MGAELESTEGQRLDQCEVNVREVKGRKGEREKEVWVSFDNASGILLRRQCTIPLMRYDFSFYPFKLRCAALRSIHICLEPLQTRVDKAEKS